jgi:hypothetical protein
MSIVSVYYEKASLPRDARNAPDLRTALRAYTAGRLLHVANVCGTVDEDDYRREYGLIHKRYANTLTIITEAVQDVEYLTKSLITWIREDYENAMTGAQKDSAGMCATELLMIVDKFMESGPDTDVQED